MRYLTDKKRHLICVPYSVENLHKMAKELDINRCWFHKDHYDIPKRRIEEIETQCQIVSSKDIVRIIRKWQRSRTMSELVKRVREQDQMGWDKFGFPADLLGKMADRIEELEAQVESEQASAERFRLERSEEYENVCRRNEALEAENARFRKALATLDEEVPHGGEGWAGKQERELAVTILEFICERVSAALAQKEQDDDAL